MTKESVQEKMLTRGRAVIPFMEWLLDETDFLTAPASTRFHGAFEGGLLKHSENVADRYTYLCDVMQGYNLGERRWSREHAWFAAFTHDVCKTNVYH